MLAVTSHTYDNGLMADTNPERRKCDFVVQPSEEGLRGGELFCALFADMVPDTDGGLTVRLMVKGGDGKSAEAAATVLMQDMQSLGVDAFPEPRHPKYIEEDS